MNYILNSKILELLQKPKGLFSKLVFKLVLLCCLLNLSNRVFAQCPTVDQPVQTFCDVESILVIDLQAIDNGNGVVWYDTPTSTTALSPTDGLIDGEDYYADDNSGSCGTRERVDVIIYSEPTGAPFQGVCVDDLNDATIADLVANGNNVQWYASSTGGSPLAETTVITDETLYYADQENPVTGCRTSRLSVFVNVGFVPTPTGDANQTFCNDPENPPTVGDLVASGNVVWYATQSSSLPLDENQILANNEDYYATTVDPPCESDTRLRVMVKLDAPNNSGTDGEILICETDVQSTGSVSLRDGLGGNPNNNGTWSGPFPTSGGPNGNVDITAMTVAGSPYVFTYTVDSPSTICNASSSTVSVSITEPPNAGEDASIELCSNDDSLDLFGLIGGTPEPGGTWSPALASGTGVFDPSVDLAGTYIYTIDGTPPCGPDTAEVLVTIIEEPDAGDNGSLELCSNDAPTDLFSSLGGTPDPGGSWSPALASGSGVFDPAVDSAGVYTYTVDGTDPCGPDSATVSVTIIEEPDAGEDANLEVCSNDGPTDLFNALGGNPDTAGSWSPALASGTGVFDPSVDSAGTYIYTVDGTPPCGPDTAEVLVTIIEEPDAGDSGSLELCSNDAPTDLFSSLGGTPDPGGSWSPALASGSGVFDPAVDSAGVYTYTVDGTDPCGPDSATVSVTIIEEPDAGEDAILEVCSNDGPTDLFNALGGNPDTAGSWSPALASGTGVFDPSVDSAGTYTYTVDGAPPCGPDTAEVAVTIIEEPDAGENGSISFCPADSPLDLFDSLGGTPDLGGSWSPILASGTGVFDPQIDSAGVYTYTVDGTDPCGPDSATVTVSITDELSAGENGSIELCTNDAPTDLFNALGGTPDAGGIWSPALASGSGIFDPSQDSPGTYTYTIGTGSSCGENSAEVTVTVESAPNAGGDASVDLCSSDSPIDLFDLLSGSPDIGGTWSPALASGTGVFDPSNDTAGEYTYTVEGGTTCESDSATVTVTIEEQPNAGEDAMIDLCTDNSPTDLFNILDGNPDSGGSWSPVLASGTGVFDPAVDSAGDYTYTVTGNGECDPDSAIVTVNITEAPNAGNGAAIDLCTNDDPIDLFDILGGTPDTGGTWSPVLASGTGVFDPAVDAEGTYTYTVSGTDPCEDASASISVSIVEFFDAGENGSITLCSDGIAVDLFESLGGDPDAGGVWTPSLASGTGLFDPAVDPEGIYTYTIGANGGCGESSAQVEVTVVQAPNAGIDTSLSLCSNDEPIDLIELLQGNPDEGGVWSPALASGTGVFDPAVDTAGEYTYTVDSDSPCNPSSATVSVTITQEPQAGNDAIIELCDNDDPIDLLTLLGNNVDTDGSWSPALASGTNIFDPITDAEGIYTYTVTGNSPCGPDEATVSITIIPGPNAGLDAAVQTCDNADPQDLFDSLGGTPDLGGTWSPALASGTGVFDPTVDPEGVYVYTVAATADCPNPDSATVSVSFIQEPDLSSATIFVDIVCLGTEGIVMINGATGLNDGDYEVDYQLTGANEIESMAMISIANGSGSFVIPMDQLANDGATQITLTGLTSNTSTCSSSNIDIPPMEFTVVNLATPELEEGGEIFCDFDNPTIASLSERILNEEAAVWYDNPTGGMPIDRNEPLVDGMTYYGALIIKQCQSQVRLAVTVNVSDCVDQLIIPDGFSPNDDGINDRFEIVKIRDIYPDFHIKIYNRYGNLLFEGDRNKDDWDGQSEKSSILGSSIVPTGVYFYILYFNDGERDEIQGRLYLSR